MSMNVADGRGGPVAAINVTPMADIMIVLLIIFMVVTPFLDEGGLKLPPAAHAIAKPPGTEAVVVSIRADGTVTLGDDRVDNLGELALKLHERLESAQGGRRIHVRADERLPYSAVWPVLQVCREAGAQEVAILSRRNVGG